MWHLFAAMRVQPFHFVQMNPHRNIYILHKSCHKVRPTEGAQAKTLVKIFLLQTRRNCHTEIHTLFKCSQLDPSKERHRNEK